MGQFMSNLLSRPARVVCAMCYVSRLSFTPTFVGIVTDAIARYGRVHHRLHKDSQLKGWSIFNGDVSAISSG